MVEIVKRQALAHDGLVPIGELRRALADVPRATFDAAILGLEQGRALHLKIANDPRAVARSEDGIRIPERGLVYYAMLP